MSRLRAATGSVPPVLALVAVLGALLSIVPLLYLVIQATSDGLSNVATEIFDDATLALVGRSLLLCVEVTSLCAVIGTTAAFLCVRTNLPFRRILFVALALPLTMPSYVAAYAWVAERPNLAGFWGATLVLTSISFPFVMLPVAAAMRRLDSRHEEVGRSLGRTPVNLAFTLTLRQIRPSLTAGSLLVALYVLSDFGAVATMRYESFTWSIYGAYRAGFNPTRAATLSLLLVLIALAIVVGEEFARGRANLASVGSTTDRPPSTLDLHTWRWPTFAALLLVPIVALLLPILFIWQWFSEGASRNNNWSELFNAFGSTLWVAFLATAVTMLFAIPIALVAARIAKKWALATDRAVFVLHALPGLVVGLGVVAVGIRALPGLYQKIPMLIAAYVILYLSLAVGSIRASIERTPSSIDDAALSLGSSRLEVFRRITLPVAAPGILSGAALVFLTVAKELPATILLKPTGFETLATELWTRTTVFEFGAAAPYAIALILVAMIPTAFLSVRGWQ